jgi:hypothetical protein
LVQAEQVSAEAGPVLVQAEAGPVLVREWVQVEQVSVEEQMLVREWVQERKWEPVSVRR